jgi:hypothetical protein
MPARLIKAGCMGREEDAKRLADDLELLQTGRLSESEFRAKWQAPAVSSLLGVIWPHLVHYLSDFDIRARDPDYAAMQDAEMAKLVQLLRAGAPDNELTKIHFLGHS